MKQITILDSHIIDSRKMIHGYFGVILSYLSRMSLVSESYRKI